MDLTPLRRGHMENARLAAERRDQQIKELKAKLAEQEKKDNKFVEPTKKRKAVVGEKKEAKKTKTVSFEEPEAIEMNFEEVKEVPKEDIIPEEDSLIEGDWSDGLEDDEMETDMEPPAVKSISPPSILKKQSAPPPPPMRQRNGATTARKTVAKLPQKTSVTPENKKALSDTRISKKPRNNPIVVQEDGSTSDSTFDAFMAGVKHHGGKFIAHGASQFVIFFMGSLFLVAKNSIQARNTNTNQAIPHTNSHFHHTPQSSPITNNIPSHYSSVQQGRYPSIDTNPFYAGPR
jgi:hypothetical protein